jgi:hypothetical protein
VRRALAAAAAVVAPTLGALGLAGPAGAATAVSGLASNYWWEAETATTQLPAPPEVPAGGLWVSSTPAGPQSVSAVRFVLAPGYSAPVLTLKVASAQPAASVAVVACEATSSWKAGPGPSDWSGRPTSDCSRGSVPGVLGSAAAAMTFALAPLLSHGSVDVVLQPAPPAPGGASPTFDATFEPVSPGEVAATAPAPAPSTGSSATGSSSGTSSSSSSGATVSPGSPLSSGAAVSAGPTASPLAGTAPAPSSGTPIAAPSLAGTPGVAAPAGPSALAGSAPAGSSSAAARAPSLTEPVAVVKGRSWRDKILLGIAIADIAGYILWSRGRPSKARPAVLGAAPALPAGTVRVGREGRPPPLR